MPLAHRIFTLAKDAEHPEENQDACRVDPRRGVAAVADGVSASLFARRWAELLAEAAVADLPDPDRPAPFADWLDRLRRAWAGEIDQESLTWFQKPKMKQGAFSTLLWMWLEEPPTEATDVDDSRRLRVVSIGDCCLFHVRSRRALRSFPITQAAELEADPMALGSRDLGRDANLRFQRLDTECRLGDWLVLTTDAVADWLLRRLEQGGQPPWDRLGAMTEPEWHTEMESLRRAGEMRYDDATLAVLEVVGRVEQSSLGQAAVPEAECCETVSRPLAASEPQPARPPLPDAARPPAAEPVPAGSESEVDLDLPPERLSGDWRERLKTLSEEFADQVGDQLTRTWEQLKKAGLSADEAFRRYRDKLRSRSKKE